MRRIGWLVVPIVLIGLLGLAVFGSRGPGPATAFTLRIGDCFDIPGDAQIGDIATLDCSKPHDAEVFVTGDYADTQPSTPIAYPGGGAFAQWVANSCGLDARGAYLGSRSVPAPDVVVGYFFPAADAWTRGERQVTCYLHARDGSKLGGPLGGAASPAASAAPS